MIGQKLDLDFPLLDNGRFLYRPTHVTGRDSERFVFFHTLVGSDNRYPFYCETFFGAAIVIRRAPQRFVGRRDVVGSCSQGGGECRKGRT